MTPSPSRKTSQPGPFAEGAEDDEVGVFLDQGQDGLAAKLVVGLVDNDEDSGFKEATNLGLAGDVAAGVVGRGKEDGLGARGDGDADGFEVDFEVVVPGDGDGVASDDLGVEGVHSEGGGGQEDVVTGPDEHTEEHVDELVAAVAADDAVGVDLKIIGQGLAEAALARVGVVIIVLELSEGLDDLGRRAVGVFVAVEADDILRGNPGLLGEDLHGVNALVGVEGAKVGDDQVLNASHEEALR